MNKITKISDELLGDYFFSIAMRLEHNHTHSNIDFPYTETQWHPISILRCFTNY